MLVLLVEEGGSAADAVRQALPGPSFRLQCVERLSMAVARLGGGGVDAVLLDLTDAAQAAHRAPDRFRSLLAASPHVPKIAICRRTDEAIARGLLLDGASGYLIREDCPAKLASAIQAAVGKCSALRPAGMGAGAARVQGGVILGFLGVKGGVGATSVALNVAATLARESRVALVEFQPSAGTLQPYFQPNPAIRDVSFLLEANPDSIGPDVVESCLWPCRRVPGLNVLFGPRQPAGGVEIPAGHAQTILAALARVADYVVADLGSSLTQATRAAIGECASLALLLERDPICLSLARLIWQQIDSWPRAPRLIAPVLVNRTPLSSPFPVADIDRELGAPPIGIVAPAPDLFLSAAAAHQPVVTLQPESMAACTLVSLARDLAREARPVLHSRTGLDSIFGAA